MNRRGGGGAMSCLVLEDDAITGPALVQLLRRNGWQAEWATSVPDARRRLLSFDPDLLLLDVHLGASQESGLELLREQRRHRRVVLLTAAGDPELQKVREEQPELEVIRKPASAEEIVRVLGRGRKGVVA